MTLLDFLRQAMEQGGASSAPGLDPVCKYVIGILVTFVLGLAGYVVKLHLQIFATHKERVSYLEGQLALIRVVKEEIRGKGGQS